MIEESRKREICYSNAVIIAKLLDARLEQLENHSKPSLSFESMKYNRGLPVFFHSALSGNGNNNTIDRRGVLLSERV